MAQEFDLDVERFRDVTAFLDAWSAASGPSRSTMFDDLRQSLAAAIRRVDDREREQVIRLATIAGRIEDPDYIEAQITLLAEACFYLSKIGRSYEGIPLASAAKELATTHGLRNLERFAWTALGLAYADGACFEEACDALERSLVLARESGNPEYECLAMTNTAMLLKEMGLYREAIEVTDRALAFRLQSVRGRYLNLMNAIHGLFSAHRLRNDEAALRYLRIGSEMLDENPLADVVQKAAFEFFRAMYLLATGDHETAEVLVDAARRRYADINNERVHVRLDIASALCDWASRDGRRERLARARLDRLHQRSRVTHIYHDDVLRALVEVHKRTLTDELGDGTKRAVDIDALSKLVTSTARTGMGYAKELVDFSVGRHAESETMAFVGGVKNAKFYRQITDREIARARDAESEGEYDPLSGAKAWLTHETDPEPIAAVDGFVGPRRPPQTTPRFIRKHDELAAIHGDMADFRVQSLRATMRTAAYDVAENWALAAEFFDDQTGEHCFRVGRLAGLLAAEIGMDAEACLRMEHAARLHDIGKIAVNEMILLKPGPLDADEIVAMRAHAEIGAQLLEHAGDSTLKMAASIARYHHAWWNGSGYPNAANEEIPLEARICAYADVYDALTNARPYKRPWPHKLAVEQMLSESGIHFDPKLMQPFLRVLERYVGSNAQPPAHRLHIRDMETNGLLRSRRDLMKTVKQS